MVLVDVGYGVGWMVWGLQKRGRVIGTNEAEHDKVRKLGGFGKRVRQEMDCKQKKLAQTVTKEM